eukprot:TRINITY_DN5555_c0_g1_i1.p1 TRINITY_DN5555_c0_g1~~TRINITY_DN5555_c0_g1_i1.p1  ORF type:complete len:291 (-),score=50.55 TRINITY_DN5555_c0_g1_i1:370-1209(-)
MAEPTILSRPPRSPGGLVEFIHNKDTPPSTPTRRGVLDVHERRLQKLESTLSPQKLPDIVDSELEEARITKARLAKQQKAQMERSAVFSGSKSVLAAMPELQQELREKQKIIDKIDADSERHRKFTSELERWLFDLKQDDQVRAERAERLAHAEDERHSWHEQMHEFVNGFKKDMSSASARAEEIRVLSGEVADEDEEESQLDRKTFELKKWKDTFDAQIDESRYRLETAVEQMLRVDLDFDLSLPHHASDRKDLHGSKHVHVPTKFTRVDKGKQREDT